MGLGGDILGVFNKIRTLFNTRAESEAVSLNDRRLLEMLGIEPGELNFKGKNALKEATVFSCIRILADSIGKLPTKVYRSNDGRQVDTSHYLTPILKIRPNPWMNSRDFFKALEVQRHLYGNSYAWIDFERKGRDAGKVSGIYPLDSTKVQIFIDDVGLLPKKESWYVYTDNKGTKYRIDLTKCYILKD